MKVLFFTLVLLWVSYGALAQNDTSRTEPPPTIPVTTSPKKWYEAISIRGYSQVRYNGLFQTNPDLGCEQCDRSWGGNGGFFIRRMRIIFFGQIHKRIYLYVQPDFANSPGADRLHFAQLRDAYFDLGLDDKNEFRFRIGQSKVPFGFENMQSSQNRIPLDRNDALNSAVANERDLGVFFYWAPSRIRKLFSELVSTGLKGSGDYGVLGLGVYNGQTANTSELNTNRHVVARFSYPFTVKNQIIEAGIQGYTGKYVLPRANVSSGVRFNEGLNYTDERVAATVVLYPQPFGIQAEYNVGRGPEFNKASQSIEIQKLTGGYLTLNYKMNIQDQLLYPFIRAQYYDGGKKHERDARSYLVRELEIGSEWQPWKNFELVVMYTFSRRRYEDFLFQDNVQKGRLLRIQAQVNF
ncbi:porin [Telluribacter sp.]|jgi:hypothetical protein|uniref:porin n=1 Tax=Telluribacter sp. TaxID=1978767 RepID=UPI002E1417ED|nr:porin [Telluribacter sp.]